MPKIRNGDGDMQDTRTGKVSKYGRARQRGMDASVHLDSEHGGAVCACIEAVVAVGDAIMFSRTSGGGIICIAVYSQGAKPEKFYCRDGDELDVALADIENAARDASA